MLLFAISESAVFHIKYSYLDRDIYLLIAFKIWVSDSDLFCIPEEHSDTIRSYSAIIDKLHIVACSDLTL